MKWLKSLLICSATVMVAVAGLCACGVKGDPLPPDKPVDLGRGRPTYRRATEKLKIENIPATRKEKDDDDQR